MAKYETELSDVRFKNRNFLAQWLILLKYIEKN